MNSHPDAWLLQARNLFAIAQLAKDNGCLAQSCCYAYPADEVLNILEALDQQG